MAQVFKGMNKEFISVYVNIHGEYVAKVVGLFVLVAAA